LKKKEGEKGMKRPGRREENRRVKKKGKAFSSFFKTYEQKAAHL
jgi:hypothetical protein